MPEPVRPHVMLITCHNLGRHLGCYSAETVRSPNLDGLAAGGRVVEELISNVDVLPTLMEAAGTTTCDDLHGGSLPSQARGGGRLTGRRVRQEDVPQLL